MTTLDRTVARSEKLIEHVLRLPMSRGKQVCGMARYEVIDLRTKGILLSCGDRDEAVMALGQFVTAERTRDDLDLVERTDDQRRSVLLRAHESGVRSLMAAPKGVPYHAFRTLAEAQTAPVAAAILEGDYGGQIYATCPARLVHCTEERLRHLVKEIEARVWNADSAQVVYEPISIGAQVAGGMGGGVVRDGV